MSVIRNKPSKMNGNRKSFLHFKDILLRNSEILLVIYPGIQFAEDRITSTKIQTPTYLSQQKLTFINTPK